MLKSQTVPLRCPILMADMFKGEMSFAGKIVFIPRQNGSNKENSELKQRIFKLEEDPKKCRNKQMTYSSPQQKETIFAFLVNKKANMKI